MDSLNIKIIGVGGAGGNAAHYLAQNRIPGVHYAAINTDAQALAQISVDETLSIGHSLTRGLSTGGDPAIARKAAEADKERIEALTQGANIVFLLTGLGAGTGSGASPVIAEIAKKQGALVISFAFFPFNIEGGRRYQAAQHAIVSLRQFSNATIPLPNDLLLQNLPQDATVLEAFALANSWSDRAIRSIINVIHKPGIINLDFTALQKVLADAKGKTLFGLASAKGEGHVERALEELELCPLLHAPQVSQTADSLLINITGGPNLSLKEVNRIGSYLAQQFKSKDNTIIGAVIDDSLDDAIEIVAIGVTQLSRGAARKKGSSTTKEDFYQQVLFDDVGSSDKAKSSRKKAGSSGETASRGYFFETEPNMHSGEDLDIPTYLRRSIKIEL